MSMGDTPKVETSQATILAAKQGAAKVAERSQDGYIALERKAAGEAGKDHTRFLARKANSDVMNKTAAPGYNPKGIPSSALSTAIGASSAKTSAASGAQQIIDKKRMMVANTGIDKSTDTAGILNTTSNLATNRSIQDAQNESFVDNAKMAAAFQVGSTAMAAPSLNKDFKQWAADEKIKDPGFSDRMRYYFGG